MAGQAAHGAGGLINAAVIPSRADGEEPRNPGLANNAQWVNFPSSVRSRASLGMTELELLRDVRVISFTVPAGADAAE